VLCPKNRDAENELRERVNEVAQDYVQKLEQRDPEETALPMGQSAAFVHAVRPAAEVVRSIGEEAERILRERSSQLLK
jgi:hypothetical protein